MTMLVPFSQTVLLWRLQRGMTQEALAQRARVSRPNLSAIERGKREVSLGTLRALAVGLDVRPGVLADGVPPSVLEAGAARLSREALERVADAVLCGTPLRDRHERVLADALRKVVRQRLLAGRQQRGRVRRGKRAAAAAWLWLESTYPATVVQSLLQRIADRKVLDEQAAN